MNSILKNERGVALIITLAVISVLLVIAFQVAKWTKDSISSIQIEKNRFQAEQVALSGLNLAKLILIEDAKTKTNLDSVQEVWADLDELSLAVQNLGFKNPGFRNVDLSLKIIDELSKIQINSLLSEFPGNQINPDQVRVLENLFNQILSADKSIEERDTNTIINSIKDWLDSVDDDAVSGLSGAEFDYYQTHNMAYTCANGPFNTIEELFNVRGLSPDLLKNEILNIDDKIADLSTLEDLFTVYGLSNERTENGGFRYEGKININTASIEVLSALLPEGKEELAKDLDAFRNQRNAKQDTFTNQLEPGWYKKVINLSKKEQTRLDRIIRYSSDIFRIESTAQLNKTTVTLVAFLKRNKDEKIGKWNCHIERISQK